MLAAPAISEAITVNTKMFLVLCGTDFHSRDVPACVSHLKLQSKAKAPQDEDV